MIFHSASIFKRVRVWWPSVNDQPGTVCSDASFDVPGVPVVPGTNPLVATYVDPAYTNVPMTATATSTVVVTDRTYAYDANGNMTTNGVFTYVWDCENRLTEVWKNGALVQSNRYDAFWRRREKIEYAPDGTAVTNRYIYKDWLVLAITDGSGSLLETYTHGSDLSGQVGGKAGGVGGILASTQADNATFYAYDFNGNILGATDASRAVVSTLTYTPFGEILSRTGSFIPRYQFSTKECAPRIDLTYYGYRFYLPILGRWMNRDPKQESGGMNIYAFVRSRVISYIDALGLTGCDDSEEIVWEEWLYAGFEYINLVKGGGSGSSMAEGGVILHYSRTGTQTFHCCQDMDATTTASYDVILDDPLVVTDGGPNPLIPIPTPGRIIPTIIGWFPSPSVPHNKPEGIDPDAYIPSEDEEGTFDPPACPCEE